MSRLFQLHRLAENFEHLFRLTPGHVKPANIEPQGGEGADDMDVDNQVAPAAAHDDGGD